MAEIIHNTTLFADAPRLDVDPPAICRATQLAPGRQ
jgi:hypothetical protein